jgi:hypothetical protein
MLKPFERTITSANGHKFVLSGLRSPRLAQIALRNSARRIARTPVLERK